MRSSEEASPEPLNVADYRRLGEAGMDPGLAGYVGGGSGGERTLRANELAFDRWALCPRVMTGVEHVDTGANVLGARLSMPVLIAPLAYLGMASPAGEIAAARAAASLGTAICVSPFSCVPFAEISAAATGPAPWLQLYLLRDRGLTRSLAEEAAAAGAGAVLVTVDAPRLGRRERDLRSGFQVPADVPLPMLATAANGHRGRSPVELFGLIDAGAGWERLEEIVESVNLPVVVKGVLAGEDARAACEHGASGVVVSNHGGRQLDGASASLDALPEVVEEVEGIATVLLDGGLRSGEDVVKALALGASAVLVGRPIFWALSARGEEGVEHLLRLLRDELELALALLGCAQPDQVDGGYLRCAPGAHGCQRHVCNRATV